MISTVDPEGTPPEQGRKRSAYAMTDPHFLPPMKAWRPIKVRFKVCDSDTDLHTVSIDLMEQSAVFLRPSLQFKWHWPWVEIEWVNHRKIICGRMSRVDNRGDPQACTGSAWLISPKDINPQLIMVSSTNAFSPAHSQVKEGGTITQRSATTSQSLIERARKRTLPRLVLVAASFLLILFSGGMLYAHLTSIADPVPTTPLVTIGDLVGTAVVMDMGEEIGPEVEPPPIEPTVDLITSASPTWSYNCKPYDPEGMSWYRYSKQPGTEGQMIVACHNGELFTTSGFQRDQDNDKVYNDLRPYTP